MKIRKKIENYQYLGSLDIDPDRKNNFIINFKLLAVTESESRCCAKIERAYVATEEKILDPVTNVTCLK